MKLNFLCLGVMKCGTTLLDSLLRLHPNIYLPINKKELHFFNDNYSRGLKWYKSYFPDHLIQDNYHAIGEVATHYLWHPSAPKRIIESVDCNNFIVVLRNPADRAYSHWKHQCINHGERKTFLEVFCDHKNMRSLGLYGEQLQRYFDFFGKERFFIIKFEDLVNDTVSCLYDIFAFLDLPTVELEAVEFDKLRKNESIMPKYYRLYRMLQKFGLFCRKCHMDRFVNFVLNKNVGVIFKKGGSKFPLLAIEERKRVMEKYSKDFLLLNSLVKIDVESWYS